jgi:transcriptional regulator with XRE-family HTH domain
MSEERENLAKLAQKDLSGVPVSRRRIAEYVRAKSYDLSAALAGLAFKKVGQEHIYKLGDVMHALASRSRLTQTEFARLIGVSPRYLKQLINESVIPKADGSEIDVEVGVNAWIKYQCGIQHRKGVVEGRKQANKELGGAKQVLDEKRRIEVERMRQDLATDRGELIAVEEVARGYEEFRRRVTKAIEGCPKLQAADRKRIYRQLAK